MPTGREPFEEADIRLGEVVWSKTIQTSEASRQQTHLSELADMAQAGVILDCAFVDVANSELLNMLVRVRTQAKKQNKGFALFNVPENLRSTIKVCNLGSLLPMTTDMVEAKKLVYNVSRGKGLKGTFRRILRK